MVNKKNLKSLGIFFLMVIILIELVLAVTPQVGPTVTPTNNLGYVAPSSSVSVPSTGQRFESSSGGSFSSGSFQFYAPYDNSQGRFITGAGTYWPVYNDSLQCRQGNDFLVQIAPFGCSPAVVRSDLLEEQDVPVFCQLDALKINPFVDVNAIDYLSFSQGQTVPQIRAVGFHPARAALKSSSSALIGSPLVNNIGYVVLVLKQIPAEKNMPDFVQGNLTATIKYDLQNAFGINARTFSLPQLTDEQWKENYKSYGFWRGKGYIRADQINPDDGSARITIYKDADHPINSFFLQQGKQSSSNVPIPGYECRANMQVKLDKLTGGDITAVVKVDDNYYELSQNEKFADNKCTVNKIEKTGALQKVEFSCSNADVKNKILTISPQVTLTVDGQDKNYSLGDKIGEFGDKNVYASYIGDLDGQPLVVLSNYKGKYPGDKLGDSELQKAENEINRISVASGTRSKLINVIAGKTTGVGSGVLREFVSGTEMKYLIGGVDSSNKDIFGKKGINVKGFIGSIDQDYSKLGKEGQDFEELFNKALENYQEVVKFYPIEKDPANANGETFAEQALWRAQELAGESGKYQTKVKLLQDFIDKYPSSNYIQAAIDQRDSILNSNGGISSTIVVIDNKPIVISLQEVNKPSCKDQGVELTFKKGNNAIESYCVGVGESIYPTEDTNEFIKLLEINGDKVVIQNGLLAKSKTTEIKTDISNRVTLSKNSPWNFEDNQVTVDKINTNPVAKVSINADLKNIVSQANFSFNIGIEKRAIQLSPEKTAERIQNLDNQIVKWNKLSDSLGATVKTLKAACLATGAGLTIKNFFQNINSGATIARTQVMRGKGGWTEKCTELKSKGDYKTLDECYTKNSDKIDADVKAWQNQIEKQNNELKNLDSAYAKQNSITQEKVIDTDKFMLGDGANKGYIDVVKQDLQSNVGSLDCGPDNKVDVNGAIGRLTNEGWKNNYFSKEDIRDLQLAARVYSSGNDDTKNMAKKELCDKLNTIYTISQTDFDKGQVAKSIGTNPEHWNVLEDKNTKKFVYYDEKLSSISTTVQNNIKNSMKDNSDFNKFISDNPNPSVGFVYDTSGKYIAMLDSSIGKNNQYPIKNVLAKDSKTPIPLVFDENGNLVTSDKLPNAIKSNNYFVKVDSSSYDNPFKKGEAVVRYYETDPYKGMPAIVPFDCQKGWYAATKQTLPFLGGIRPQDESGKITSFFLCNVGENGIEEFDKNIGDDKCEMINLGTGQPYNQILGLNDQEAQKRVKQAQAALQQAAEKYKPGLQGRIAISVSGASCDATVGTPQTNVPQIQCQDTMSPSDCKLLFNVCDPVICPSSRCNLGGNYYVNDVIQSGIIGSIALCLPNAREGIAVPICLTGVKAGVDGVVSIMNATRSCLQEQLTSGKTVGICDEIQSIYMCDFFWKEAGPISNIAIPKLAEIATGQNVRGGGEYLSVQDSWNNAEKSIGYMRDYYGANAYKAFQARSTDEIGSTICKSFVSARYPNNKNFFDSLITPDSPTQYHAWFSETSFTTATIPATSQYKVFYHIYAGKDIGATYYVYLKSPTEISGYNTNPRVIVAQGYIPIGQFADETRDFTAPSGYKDLCISVNGQENCGFQRVSTSFALEYVKEQFLASQTSQNDITTEKNCISGSPSIYSLAQPNLQTGVQQTINPQLYDYGIIRVCSTDNPGKNTNPERWKDVGYCDNNKIRCWIDSSSISNQIKIETIQNQALDSASKNYIDQVTNGQGLLDDARVVDGMLKSFADDLNNINQKNVDSKVSGIDVLIPRIILSYQKAWAILIKGDYYGQASKDVLKDAKIKQEVSVSEDNSRKGVSESEKKIISLGGENKNNYDQALDAQKNAIDDIYKNDKDITDVRYNSASGKLFVATKTNFYAIDKDAKTVSIVKGTTSFDDFITSSVTSALTPSIIDNLATKWGLDAQQKTNLKDATSCSYCGGSPFDSDFCPKNECDAISEKLIQQGKNGCDFQNVWYKLGGSCVEKVVGTPTLPSQPVTATTPVKPAVLTNIVHNNIIATTFWVGESEQQKESAFDNYRSEKKNVKWIDAYGGIDRPEKQFRKLNNLFCPNPNKFVVGLNTFYAALPCNPYIKNEESLKADSWIKITNSENGNTAYAQWEDVGPHNTDDCEYVYGKILESKNKNGIDLSPAVMYYLSGKDDLGEKGITLNSISWQFVDEKDVSDGSWKNWQKECALYPGAEGKS